MQYPDRVKKSHLLTKRRVLSVICVMTNVILWQLNNNGRPEDLVNKAAARNRRTW